MNLSLGGKKGKGSVGRWKGPGTGLEAAFAPQTQFLFS